MAGNNLRIITSNKITAVNGSTTANSLNDYRTRYDTGTTFTLTVANISGNVALAAVLTERTSSITMTVTYNTTNVAVSDTTSSNYTTSAGFGGGKYITAYFTVPSGVTSLTITFSASVNVSRFIYGNYWSPVYNTSFGVQVGYDDASSSERLQSGDLYSTIAPRHKTMQFDLQYMDESDKFKLFDIYRALGKAKPLFVSVFPADTDKEKEQMYSIYGKLTNLNGISYVMFTMYASSLQLEEI